MFGNKLWHGLSGLVRSQTKQTQKACLLLTLKPPGSNVVFLWLPQHICPESVVVWTNHSSCHAVSRENLGMDGLEINQLPEGEHPARVWRGVVSWHAVLCVKAYSAVKQTSKQVRSKRLCTHDAQHTHMQINMHARTCTVDRCIHQHRQHKAP